MDKAPLSLLLSRLDSSNSLILSSYERCSGSVKIFMPIKTHRWVFFYLAWTFDLSCRAQEWRLTEVSECYPHVSQGCHSSSNCSSGEPPSLEPWKFPDVPR